MVLSQLLHLPNTQAADTAIFRLHISRKQGEYKAYFGFSSLDASYLKARREQYLHAMELQQYNTHFHENRKYTFLHGRFLAKTILSHYLNEPEFTNIAIKPGVFEQPLVMYSTQDKPAISIAHTSTCAACLVFSEEHPMAIDMEIIAPDAKENISSQLTYFERCLNHTLEEEDCLFYTRLWTIKEALSKLLKTGLMTPLEVFEINSISRMTDKAFTMSTFTNFSQYKAFSFIWKNAICSIVLPKESTICSILTVN